MYYVSKYHSPIGTITIASNGHAVTGLWFYGQKYYADTPDGAYVEQFCPVLNETMRWLDVYFSGKSPDFLLPLEMHGSPFRTAVWELLRGIPYGQTVSYGQIAKMLEERTGKRVSAQAVGGAVGRNPISIIVPCHRVLGANGNLTGYAGGIDMKLYLLKSEGVDTSAYFVCEKNKDRMEVCYARTDKGNAKNRHSDF